MMFLGIFLGIAFVYWVWLEYTRDEEIVEDEHLRALRRIWE